MSDSSDDGQIISIPLQKKKKQNNSESFDSDNFVSDTEEVNSVFGDSNFSIESSSIFDSDKHSDHTYSDS